MKTKATTQTNLQTGDPSLDMNELLNQLLDYARQHGLESDPEHEISDLQQLLTACWNALDDKARESIYLEYARLWELSTGMEM